MVLLAQSYFLVLIFPQQYTVTKLGNFGALIPSSICSVAPPPPLRDPSGPPVVTGALSRVLDPVSCFRHFDGFCVCLWASLRSSVANLPLVLPRVRSRVDGVVLIPEVLGEAFLPFVAPRPRTQSQELF